MQAWLIDHIITLCIGLALGWILLKRPEWVGEFYQWFKHNILKRP